MSVLPAEAERLGEKQAPGDGARAQSGRESRLCFILGIMPRSGTNYLYALLAKHPEITPLEPLYEDFLVHHSSLLVDYTNKLYKTWRKWEVEERFGAPEVLLRRIGSGICQFLADGAGGTASAGATAYLLLKTPSVLGLDHFFRLFPAHRVIVLVRDGRAVVESGMRSFGWQFEPKVREWAEASREVRGTLANHGDDRQGIITVRYEDLFTRPGKEMGRILSFLNLEAEKYDFEAAEQQDVIGSSDTRRSRGERMHWAPQHKRRDFDPLRRWERWSRSKHERFNWIAGDELTHWGYSPRVEPRGHLFFSLWNRALDAGWRGRRLAGRTARRLRGLLAGEP